MLVSLAKIVLCATVIIAVFGARGFDSSQIYSSSIYSCLRQTHNMSFTMFPGYLSTGTVNPQAIKALKILKQQGFSTDITMFACGGKNATDQVNEMMSAIPSDLYGMIWIIIDVNKSPGCLWTGDSCDYATQLVEAVKARGQTPGIYSYTTIWTTVMGYRSSCQRLSDVKLWYRNLDQAETLYDYGWVSLGGWTDPTIKKFSANVSFCNGSAMDLDYRH